MRKRKAFIGIIGVVLSLLLCGSSGDDQQIRPLSNRPPVQIEVSRSHLSLVDQAATKETRSLMAWLSEVRENYLLFGQQHANTQSIVCDDGITSDIFHLVNTYPAVIGYDMSDIVSNTEYFVEKAREAYRQNCIITLSDHMPNFSAADTSKGSNDLTPTIRHIMPQGKDHQAFLRRLDLTAAYAAACVDEQGRKIPIIYRPFHECSGSWFWWGKDNITTQDYIELWQFTVKYLRDVKGVDNFLYAYSPNGHFDQGKDYLTWYPGDDYVDILGFDIYQDGTGKTSEWMNRVRQDARIVVQLAEIKGKIPVMSEMGRRYNDSDGLRVNGNEVKAWFSLLADTLSSDPIAGRLAYMMAWRNEDTEHFFVPYQGHEMADEFISFYNQENILFADRLGNVYDLFDGSAEN